jgi:hypothetical protein
MQIISHRGNINGPSGELENNPKQITQLLQSNIHVEIDVFDVVCGEIFLGHDYSQYVVNKEFLLQKNLWIHAKSFSSLQFCLTQIPKTNFFYHTNEDYIMTSHGFIWTYPDINLMTCEKSIFVLPEKIYPNKEKFLENHKNCFGVCTDYFDCFV